MPIWDLSTKRAKLNIEIRPENLGVIYQMWGILSFLYVLSLLEVAGTFFTRARVHHSQDYLWRNGGTSCTRSCSTPWLIQMTLTMDSREGQLSFENTYPLCPSPSVWCNLNFLYRFQFSYPASHCRCLRNYHENPQPRTFRLEQGKIHAGIENDIICEFILLFLAHSV